MTVRINHFCKAAPDGGRGEEPLDGHEGVEDSPVQAVFRASSDFCNLPGCTSNVIRRLKTSHSSALENRPPGGWY